MCHNKNLFSQRDCANRPCQGLSAKSEQASFFYLLEERRNEEVFY